MESPSHQSREQVTHLLVACGNGERDALDRLMPLLYDELRKIARHHLRDERAGHTLDTSALIHEAYLRLVDETRLSLTSRRQFYGVASRLMRNLLVDHARMRGAAKRGGDRRRTSLDDNKIAVNDRAEELLAIDQALGRLEVLDERLSRVVECRFFGGLTIDQTAGVLDVSSMTVKRDWNKAKAWLYQELRSVP